MQDQRLLDELARLRRRNAVLESAAVLVDEKQLTIEAIENISEAFVIYDEHGLLVTCSDNFRKLHGYSEDEARRGIHFRELAEIDAEHGNTPIADEIGGGEAYLARKAAYQRKLEGSFTVNLKDGRWIRTTDRRLPSGGFVSIQSDITESKLKEIELRNAKEIAEFASRAKSEFLANMSHEFRTPLNAVIGFADALKDGVQGSLTDGQKEYVEFIKNSGEHLLTLITHILDLSKIEAGKFVLNEAEVGLENLIKRSMVFFKDQAVKQGIKLTVKNTTGLPNVYVDERTIMQIIMNLLSNALKFTAAGGHVTLSTLRRADGGIDLMVSDDGVGMSEEEIPMALAPFEQTESGRGWGGGTGLGLPIVQHMIEHHGGALELESKVGQGTTVTIRIPASRVR
jgi:two-component system cell cycle sensor histidine kinase PleC